MIDRSLTRRTVAILVCVALWAIPATAAANANANNTADAVTAAPTFYKDVLPVLQENCQVCHRPNGANLGGMVAPMAFTSYNDTRPWARSIARQVEARTMPPWHADAQHNGVFSNERTITDADVTTLVTWAQSGAPAGDVADAPAARQWPASEGWTIGEPDLVLDMGQDYFVEDDVEDQYIRFTTKITEDMLPEPRWIQAVEFRPGTPVVHHIITRPLGGIAPGNDPTTYNDGFAVQLQPGTELTWRMHYHKEAGEGTGAWDRSSVAVRFYPEGYEPDHIVQNEPAGKFDFKIPAGDANYSQVVTHTFDRETLLLGYTPHMHLRGKSAQYLAKYPDGTEEVLLEVPKYDFNWQTHYEYPQGGKKIPAGTKIELTMAWDNSADNPSNPDPSIDVTYGGPTTSEMMFGFISYADAEKGYVSQGGAAGLTGGESSRRFDPERMKGILKERYGIDWDTLSEEQQQKIRERFSGGRTKASPETVGGD